MLGVDGPALSPAERELLRHPTVGGVILFSRNYANPEQLSALVEDIHGLREPQLLVGVDQEGGTVQRFRSGFTRLPPPARFGTLYDESPHLARDAVEICGWLLAAELRSLGVDFSFTPVLDLGRPQASVVGTRAFHQDPDVVSTLAQGMIKGMRSAGMAAVGKHFPGHGGVVEDSHHTTPVDDRDLATLRMADLVPFERLIRAGLPAVIPAHVVYPAVDERPAGFSERWLRRILRRELGFEGAVFSDDLGMGGAAVAGDLVARAEQALGAGCDMVLSCNDPAGAVRLVERLSPGEDPLRGARLARMHGRRGQTWDDLHANVRHREAAARMSALEREPELDLGDDATS